ncbi:type IX secretion system periplasmic lipoprotein PorW/SprE [Pontibacter lucknowensis]|uniref:Tetratricopeptide repeat-containing protein n=1 Tax=Pontibacter lucknowensis TaxID=1077936 RepID=A0A1N6V229_9BACT|nr:tetratricopeptide repeat protein [Pontibacter lucknowensis]SIQ71890.1 Tetratricopeptide repeat-containing protein [Pontibacter lucknowensis]
MLHTIDTLSKNPSYILFLLSCLILAGCSAERNNPLSKAYHNTTARYNGYFLAKEKLEAIEKSIQDQTVYDYNRPLPIFPPIDSATYKAHAADLEDVIKKASFPIQYHPNSKWIDDSYLVIGKVRFYELNFPEAAQTFRYVNSTGKDRHVKHEALVWLMRAFLKLGETDNAWQVSEFLRKERLNRDNARELYLARAEYHLMQGDTAAVIENLDLSLPNFTERDDQSRVRFSLARLYQDRGQSKEAYQQYSRILRRNPPYDLGFFSRLYLGQVSELDDAQDLNRIAGYYQKMLRDEKNTEYRDKIYYEMAVFERRQQHYDKALQNIEQSLKTPGSIPNQKAYTYLLAGQIYFENLNKYDLAQAYYDSAVQVYPQQAIEYEQVLERRNVLADFTKQYNTIQLQDSLQQLAAMSEGERLAFVQNIVQQEEEMRQQEQARQLEQDKQRKARRAQEQQAAVTVGGRNNPNAALGAGNTGGVFYFDNPAAMATARSEFVRRWGDRPLQDNWRLLSRGEIEGGQDEAVAMEAPVESAAEAETEESRSARLQTQVETYLQNIPTTTLAIQQSEKLLEDAMFRLANIYSQKLNSPDQATATYEKFLQRFPQSEHAAEAHYSLYLIYSRAGSEQKETYYAKIKQQYPNTIYAKLVDDPNYMSQNALDNIKAHALYDSAYAQYELGEYQQATTLLKELSQVYPLNDIPDKVAFLHVMITARSERPELLQQQLLAFKQQHPSSPLTPRADELLKRYQDLESKQQLRQEAPAPPTAQLTDERTPEQRVNNSIALASARERNAALQQQRPATALPIPDTTATNRPDTTATTQVGTPLDVAAVAQDTATAQAPAVQPPAADPLAYTNAPDSAYYFVMLYPTEHAAFKDIEAKYEKYNNTYFRNQKLMLDQQPFDVNRGVLLLRAFPNMKEAQAYNIKQKAPQSPIGKIRGVEFITFAISSDNWQKLLQKKDVEEYLNYFRTNN